MAMMRGLPRDPIERLADDVHAKILAKRDLLVASEGVITIRIFRKNEGHDIKLTVTTT
jgi:hypothetical protein